MIVIQNCPFCAHDDVEIDEVHLGEYAVCCPECRCIGPITGNVMEAIAYWNDRRAIEPVRTWDEIKQQAKPARERTIVLRADCFGTYAIDRAAARNCARCPDAMACAANEQAETA